jgi:hypothetical protein
VVAVAVVLSLVLLEAPSSGPSASQAAVSFSSARSTANATADAHGTWLLAEASGVDSANATTYNIFNSSNFPNCNLTSFTGPIPTNVTFPAYRGNLSSGNATDWWFFYYQPSQADYLLVFVTGGVVSVAFELSGPTCSAGWGPAGPISDAVDSTVAVTNALSAGGSAFLQSHPEGVSLSLNVQGNEGWFVEWSTCSVFPGPYGWSGFGSEFVARANVTTGVVQPGGTYNGTCGTHPPIAVGLGLGTPTLAKESSGGTLASQGCTGIDYCYYIPITRAILNVTPGDLSLGVFQNSNGVFVTGYAVLDANGQVVVSAYGTGTGAGGTAWSPGTGTSNTSLTTTMRLTVDMGSENPAGHGYVLAVEGWGSYFALSPYFAVPLP